VARGPIEPGENVRGLVSSELSARVRRIHLRTHRLVNTALAGAYRSTFRGQGIEFEEVRPYIPGDDVRSIDWNVTARTGEAFVKTYREERELTVHLLVDVGDTMDFGTRRWSKREAAAQFAGLLALVALRNQDRVGLTLFGSAVDRFLSPTKGSHHVLRIVREVLGAGGERGLTDLAGALEATERLLRRRAMIFLVSDLLSGLDDERWVEVLARLSRRHDVIVARVIDPLEERFPAVGPLKLRDGAGRVTEIDGRSPAVRASWEAAAAERRRALNARLARAQVERLELATERDLVEPLIELFRRRERARGDAGRRRRGG